MTLDFLGAYVLFIVVRVEGPRRFPYPEGMLIQMDDSF